METTDGSSGIAGQAARRWATLAGHVLVRAHVLDDALVEVRSERGRSWFLVSEGVEERTLDDVSRELALVSEGTPDVVVGLDAVSLSDVRGAWTVAVSARQGVEVACPGGKGQALLEPAAFEAALRALSVAAKGAPGTPLGTLSLADEREVAAVLTLCGAVGAPVEETPLARVQRRLGEIGDATIEDRRGRTTLRQVMNDAGLLAARLSAAGAREGSVIGLHLRRTRDELVSRFATWMTGAAFVPLDPKLPDARLTYMLENARATFVLSDFVEPGFVRGAGVRVLSPASSEPPIASTFAARLPGAGDLAYVLYTSGSTGRPKGVEISHGNLANLMTAMCDLMGVSRSDVIGALASFSFDMSVPDWLLPFWAGCSVAIASEEELEEATSVAAFLERTGATFVQATPTRYRQLLESGWRPSRRLTRIVGGEALSESLAEALLVAEGDLWNMYGPTEVAVWATGKLVRRASEFASVGRPLRNVSVRVVDRCGRIAPREFPGELYLGGESVGLGYRGRDDLTKERFVTDPTGTGGARMYRTGDGVRLRADGELDFLGRLDSQVKIRGYRVELEEVEAALAALPGVTAAAAKVDQTAGVPKLVGYVVCGGGAVDRAAMKKALRDRLPDYMVPTLIEVLAALPTTRAGKIDRIALPPPTSAAGSDDDAPRSSLEERIAAVVAKTFGVPTVGVTDDFTDLGGFSLVRARLVNALKEVGLRVSLPDVYRFATVRALAAHMESQASAAGAEAHEDLRLVEVPGVGAAWPTTGIQQKIYLDVKSSKEPGQWHIVHAYALYDEVDLEILRQAVTRVFERHEALRCSFHLLEDGTLAQVPRPAPGFVWEEVQRELPDGGVPELQAEQLRTSLDLERGELNRFVVVEAPEDDTRILLWKTHEIVGDAWSAVLVLREVELCYHQIAAGGAGIPYPNVGFSKHLLRIQQAEPTLAPRAERLFGQPRIERGAAAPELTSREDALRRRLGVPTDALVHCATGARVFAPMPFFDDVEAACRRFDVTPSVLVQAALALALIASGDEDLRLGADRAAFGMYVVNRIAEEERSVGHYSTYFPLVVTVPEGATVRTWLTSVRRSIRDLLSIESGALGDVLSRAPADVVRRAVAIQLSDDGYPWFLAESAEEEKIFDLLTPLLRSAVDIAVLAMMRPPYLLFFRYPAERIAAEKARKLLDSVFEMGSRLVNASGEERVRDWLAPGRAEEENRR